jgi:GAF domain-containing protein
MNAPEEAAAQWRALRTGFWPTDLANASAFWWERLPDLNWAGFYLLDGDTLRLGPFQGRVACTEIARGRGVCGRAVVERRTQLVPDVREFAGHIACDARSRAELVVPLIKGGEVWGVLDLDSPTPGRFHPEDARALEEFREVLLEPWARKPWP